MHIGISITELFGRYFFVIFKKVNKGVGGAETQQYAYFLYGVPDITKVLLCLVPLGVEIITTRNHNHSGWFIVEYTLRTQLSKDINKTDSA